MCSLVLVWVLSDAHPLKYAHTVLLVHFHIHVHKLSGTVANDLQFHKCHR